MMRLAMTLALAVPMALSAQMPQILPGARVKVKTATETFTGTVMSQIADTIDVAENGAIRRHLPVSAVLQLFVSKGKTAGNGAIKGMKIGALIGAVVALAEALIWAGTGVDPSEGAAFVTASAVGGGLWGLLIGAIVGAEGWKRIY